MVGAFADGADAVAVRPVAAAGRRPGVVADTAAVYWKGPVALTERRT